VHVDLGDDTIDGRRRLDGGRRERLTVRAPAVLSVEGATASLRRAPLTATIAAAHAAIERRAGWAGVEHTAGPTRPFRPRPRSLPAPSGDSALARISALLKADAGAARSDPITLDPATAAERILAELREWGELGPG
jgi:electron transfer flavoprotein beta subunit